MRLGLKNFGAFELHGVVQEDAKGFRQALQSMIGQMLRGRVQFGIFVSVGHLIFFLFLV